MAKTELFWLGDGVITIDSKEYGPDMPLPTDKLNSDDLKKLKADGRVGAKIAVIDLGNKALKVLQEKIEDLESAECKECAVIQALLDTANEQIADLEAQLEEATEPKKEKK